MDWNRAAVSVPLQRIVQVSRFTADLKYIFQNKNSNYQSTS
jgi:hypothetical protein